jgi:hypothetical protein
VADGRRGAARGGWLPRERAVPAAVLTAYSGVRVAALVWGIARGGSPATVLAWTDVAGAFAAAGQGLVAALLLARPALRRPVLGWSVAGATVGVAVLDAAVWVALGSGQPTSRARDVVLAVAFATGIVILAGWRPRWAVHHTGAADWARLRRALAILVGGAALVAVVAGAARLAATSPAGVWYRAATLLLIGASLVVVVALLAIAVTVGEQRAEAREERHRQLAEAHRAYHDDRQASADE